MTSQYKCETCGFKGKGMMGDERCPYDTQKSNEDNCDLLYSYKRTNEEKELMDICGLTCHSDFTEVRKQVLNDLIDRVNFDSNFTDPNRDYWISSRRVKEYVEELRNKRV